jgi:hypothetical protein
MSVGVKMVVVLGFSLGFLLFHVVLASIECLAAANAEGKAAIDV